MAHGGQQRGQGSAAQKALERDDRQTLPRTVHPLYDDTEFANVKI